MTDESKEKDDYQFMSEQIVPKRKHKFLKRLGTAGFVVLMAALFGLVAEIVMVTSENVLREWLGIEAGTRLPVNLSRPTPPPSITPTPVPTKQPTMKPSPSITPTMAAEQTPEPTMSGEPTKNPDAPVSVTPVLTDVPVTPEPTETVTMTPTPTEEVSEPTGATEQPGLTPGAEQTPGAELTPDPTGLPTVTPTVTPQPTMDPMESYLEAHRKILSVAEEVFSSLVVVEAIEEGVDWFQEIYVTRTRTTGLVLANDGIDLLILADLDRISGANLIEVYFGETVVAGRVYSMDKSYGLAVIAVPLVQIPAEVLENVSLGMIAADGAVHVGAPVLALGAPNGYEGSLEFGMITSLGGVMSVPDGQISYFTTDMADRKNGYGFVVNLDGEILGMMTHKKKADAEDGIFSVISFNEIQSVIVKLLNNESQAYFGIIGQDLPRSVKISSGFEAGVYVSEVENASPALNAGIKAGDIILSVAGTPVGGIAEFNEVLLGRSVREIVVVKLMRRAEDGMREMSVEVPLTVKN